MEQESEGQAAKMRILEFERKVRSEALSGCQQIKNVEDHIRDAPEGGLLGLANGAEGQALRTTILNASAAIVEKFSKVIRLLSTPPHTSRSTSSMATGGSKAQEQHAARAGNLSLDADSPLLSTEDSHTPGRMQITSPNTSPCDTPLSGSGMSEGSPGRVSNQLAPDSDEDTGGNLTRRRPHDVSANADPELSEKPALPKKRKYLPKFQMKQRAIGTGDPANDGPPDDGYTWRKYGQKDIKESAYPRSYYRCTHKTDLGCPSIKMVQRSDEDPNYYDVTYRGHHICPSMEQRTWHFGLAPSHIAIHELLTADPKGPSSALMTGTRPLLLSTPGQSQENVIVGTGRGPVPFSAPKSTCGLTVPPSNNKSYTATTTATITTTTSSEHNQIIVARFGLSSPATTQQQQEQNLPANSASNRLHQDGFNQNKAARDSIFGPHSNLMNLLLGRHDGGSVGLELEDLAVVDQGQQQQRQTTANLRDTEQTRDIVRSNLLNSVSMASSQDQQYVERWAESGMLMSFQHQPPAPSEITGRCTPSPATSEVGTSHAQQIRPTPIQNSLVSYNPTIPSHIAGPGGEMYNIPTTESDASEVISPASPSPFSMGMAPYMLDSPGSHQQMYMDYEFQSYYDSSQTD